MTTAFRALDLADGALEESLLAPPNAEPLTGDITVRTKVFHTSADTRIVSGVWESEPGEARWEFIERGAVIQVVAGSMTVSEDGGEPVTLTAGAGAVFPIGWKGTWTVHERLRKVFVVYRQ